MSEINKLNLVKQNEYVIEVNDNGDTISFNPGDTTLLLRLDSFISKINKLENKYKGESFLFEKKKEEDLKNGILTKGDKEMLKKADKMLNECRKIADEFIGEGACQKIFGDTNYLGMFEDLLTALQPHFEKIGLSNSTDKYIEAIEDKYQDNEDDVLS